MNARSCLNKTVVNATTTQDRQKLFYSIPTAATIIVASSKFAYDLLAVQLCYSRAYCKFLQNVVSNIENTQSFFATYKALLALGTVLQRTLLTEIVFAPGCDWVL